ncbi:MAG: hypothetical protein SFU25_10715 [Candidatus Caenarcaniphilales bacterium]|nr:hypothetical protein [Candidatus Caenarcaniphilales bacterium]
MTKIAKTLSFFPLLHLFFVLVSLYNFFAVSFIFGFILSFFSIYFLPILCFRFHNRFYPYREGRFFLDRKEYVPWWGVHQFQLLFIALPALESILRLYPGFYSFWLRLWGSKIGKNVYWTPLVEILDRSNLEIGSNVIIGHKVCLLAHVINSQKSGLILYVKNIKIGSNSLIGAGSRFGPGAVVEDGSTVPVLTDLKINETFQE